jgi:hypothetical protein
MDDESHPRLRIALESLLNQTTVGLRFSKRRSLWFNSQWPADRWRNIPITLTNPDFGEQKAQTCVIA